MTSVHLFALLLLALVACQATDSIPSIAVAPRAKVVPERLEAHGDVRIDDYYWMREREDPEVVAYLEAENAYTAAVMAPTEALQKELYEEMIGRVRQDDSTVPTQRGDWWYYTRFEEGSAYPIHCRKHGDLDAPEEILLDLNKLSEGHGYFAIGGRSPSPDHTRLAYGVDTRGRRIYTLEVLDLATREISDRIEGISPNVVWAEDGQHLFYARRDPQTLRTYQIWRHQLGADSANDALVFEETDETYSCFVSKTRSKRFITITSRQTLATEVRMIEADSPLDPFLVILPRERDHEYSVDHHGDYLYLRTNKDAPNFRLVRAPLDDPSAWEEVVPHRPDVLLEGVLLFQDHMVLRERREGLRRLTVRTMADGSEHELEFDDPAYQLWVNANPEFNSPYLRFSYSSLTTPSTVYDYDLVSHERTQRKRDQVGGGFDSANYKSERLWAEATDGTRVPISLVYRQPFERDGSRPLLLYAYGSYGSSMDAGFSANVISLLDRGFVYAIAHVRGGQELGRAWYEDGKLLHKRNTFTDFIDCGEHLVAQGYTSPERLCAMGGSAGGLLVGAVVNMRPDLFAAAVAAVPFVDVVTTMLDASIPLTTFEWDEWGDPRERGYYEYMLSYSPYDQVARQDYPAMLVTTGFHDSQVQYWEPAKWVAKLRAMKTDERPLVFKTEMEAGHGGRSGRYERYKNQALTYAFLLSNVR
jgi:oligopeptidase B